MWIERSRLEKIYGRRPLSFCQKDHRVAVEILEREDRSRRRFDTDCYRVREDEIERDLSLTVVRICPSLQRRSKGRRCYP